MQWEKVLPSKEWMETYLTVLDGVEKGNYTTKYTPYLDLYFELIDNPKTELLAVMSASQIGKTLAGSGFILHAIDTSYSNKLVIIPNEKDLSTYLSAKFDVFLRGCKKVADKITETLIVERLRGKQTIKKFVGGDVTFLGSFNVKSLTVQHILCDEVSDFAPGALAMIRERFKTYRGKGGKLVAISTMKNENDEIYNLAMMCEIKMQYWMYCEHCGGYFYPEVKHHKYHSQKEFAELLGLEQLEEYMISRDYLPFIKENSYIECPYCAEKITDEHRKKAILGKKCKWFQVLKVGVDKQTKQDIWIEDTDPKDIKQAGSISLDLCSYVSGLVGLDLITEERFLASSSIASLQKFYIGWANRIYHPDIVTSEQHRDLLSLGNGLRDYMIPTDTVYLTLTIDTQKIGFWYMITAFCPNEVTHIINGGWIEGFDTITKIFSATYIDSSGNKRGIDAIGIDRQGIEDRTAEVDYYCNWLSQSIDKEYIFPLIGKEKDRNNRALWAVKIDSNKSDLAITAYGHNTSYAKFTIANYLARSVDNFANKRGYDNRIIYLNQDLVDSSKEQGSSAADSIEKQLTSEHFIYPVDKNGKVAREGVWTPTYGGRPNHLLDCLVMAFNISSHKKINLATASDIVDYDKIPDELESIYKG